MNYIELINHFWNAHREYCFSPVEIALYFYLLDVSNGLGWKNPFNHTNTFITGVLGISEKTLITARRNLEEAGLIGFEGGNGRRYSSTYYIKGCNNSTLSGTLFNKRGNKGVLKGSNSSILSGVDIPGNNKQNDTKLNNNLNTGGTTVPQHTPEELNIGDFKPDLLKDGTTTPLEEETTLNGKFEENNDLPKDVKEKKKNCAKKEKTAPAQFQKPTLEEVADYCIERNNDVNPEQWLDFYTSNGWKVGKNPMKDWKAAVRTWERNGINNNSQDNGRKEHPASGLRQSSCGTTSKTGFDGTL